VADGTQMVPAVATRAGAKVQFQLNNVSGMLSGNVRHSVTDSIGATVRLGAFGVNGNEVIALIETQPGEYSVPEGTVLSGEQIVAFEAGRLHVIVASAAHPAGEIRAQLSEARVDITVQPNLDDIQAKVFTPVCSGCHTGSGQTLPSIINFATADASYNSLVNTPSLQQPELDRVSANDADNSYLIQKLEGTHQNGSQMPFRGTPLDTDVVDAIRAWINNGASR